VNGTPRRRRLLPSVFSGEFQKYLAAEVLTSVGSGMHFVAMSWFLYQRTGHVTSIGLNLIITTLPGVLFSPFIGVLVDRWSDQAICVVSDVLRGAILLCLVLSMYLDVGVVETIYLSSFLVAICEMFFQPAVGALIRDISTKETLLDANVASNMSMQIGTLCGASLGGVVLAQFGILTVILLNVASFFASAGLTMWIRKSAQVAAQMPVDDPLHFGRALRDTLHYVGKNQYLVWLAIVQMFSSITLYVCNTLLPVFVARELGGGPQAFGMIDAAWGVGALLGGLGLAHIARRFRGDQISMVGLLLVAAAVGLFLSSRSLLQAVVGYFALGFIICVVRISTSTIIVADVDPAYFGRIKSGITMFISYVSLGVYGTVGYLGDRVSVRWIFTALGGAILGGFLLRPRRGLLPGVHKRA
jgi:DHA3 family macrolide efflux protein-like MFS transporter